MEQNNPQRIQQIIEQLQSRRDTPEVMMFRELLSLQLRETKNSFLNASVDTFSRLQGEAKAYEKSLKLMDRPSLTQIKQKKEDN